MGHDERSHQRTQDRRVDEQVRSQAVPDRAADARRSAQQAALALDDARRQAKPVIGPRDSADAPRSDRDEHPDARATAPDAKSTEAARSMADQQATLQAALERKDYDAMKAIVSAMDFAAEKGQSLVLWTGRWAGVSNEHRAKTWCQAHDGWTSLELTPNGAVLDRMAKATDGEKQRVLPREVADELFKIASLKFVNSASGVVLAFAQRNDGKEDRTYHTVEKPRVEELKPTVLRLVEAKHFQRDGTGWHRE